MSDMTFFHPDASGTFMVDLDLVDVVLSSSTKLDVKVNISRLRPSFLKLGGVAVNHYHASASAGL